uniref:Aryl hydrocarbon receptor n=1 Tax=Maylandia zebra TaxID=106582 RepID=A0A3P9CFS4_9CICH|nr:aryl hydrocarbon receptor [Maylandia zebra]
MLPNTALYAAKKRKKPVQKMPKPPPPEGAKSNPSKRHRDRLNGELDKLTSLLPFTEEVRSRLDKLSVLRLSVGYLKVKGYFNATMKMGQNNNSSYSSERSIMFGGNSASSALQPSSATSTAPSSFTTSTVTSIDGVNFSEGDLLLQALSGFVLVVTAEGYVFYTSPTIQDFLGFHQSDVVHQSVFELIHTDDRAFFRQQLHFSFNPNTEGAEGPSDQSNPEISRNIVSYDPHAVPPENSSFLERNFCCRLRCLLDNSSGFLALNFHGRLKFLHNQNHVSEDGSLVPPQLALFAIATPMQQPSILEIRTKTLMFQTKHKMDFTPIGVDARAKLVLGYSEIEISRKGSGYNFIHAADMLYCAENHVRMMKTGESGITIFRLLTKAGRWVWVQANARLIIKNGKPEFIVAQQRALTNEEGEEQLHLRRLQVPFNYATGEALLYDVTPNIEPRDPCSAPKQGKFDSDAISRESLLGCMLNQDHTLYCDQNSANTLSNLNDMVFKDTNATLNVPGDTEPSPAVGNVVKAETTVQEIMESLQQIFGDGELIESLHVEPDELKSWESTLLQMSCHGGFGDDLSDILNNDILSYVEEQLQKDVGLNLPQQIDGIPACLSGLDPLQNQDPDQGGELDFDWALETQTQLIPNGVQMTAAQETMKLSHMDFPQPNSSGPNGLTFNNVLPNSFPQTQSQLKASSMDNNLGAFPLRQPSTNPGLLQMIPANQTFGLQDQNKEGQLNNVFTFQGTKCSKSVTHQADSCGETFASNISNKAVFSSSLSCMQSHFPVQTPNGNSQRQAWPQQQQLITGQQMGSFQRNPTDIGSLNKFMTPETSNPLPVQQLLERSPASTSCMYRNAAPGLPVNGVHHSQPRLNPAPSQIPSNPSCFYQVGGRAISGMASIPNLDEASLSCQMPTGLKPNGLLGQQKQYLNFSEQTQMNNRPVVGNGVFPFPSLPNGNMCYSENK